MTPGVLKKRQPPESNQVFCGFGSRCYQQSAVRFRTQIMTHLCAVAWPARHPASRTRSCVTLPPDCPPKDFRLPRWLYDVVRVHTDTGIVQTVRVAPLLHQFGGNRRVISYSTRSIVFLLVFSVTKCPTDQSILSLTLSLSDVYREPACPASQRKRSHDAYFRLCTRLG